MLQFITKSDSQINVVEQIKGAIAGGCRWVQLCDKQATDDQIKALVAELKPICAQAEAVLLLHNRVELAKELEIDGVFLEKGDMPPTQAREILGAGPIIGVTVNSANEIGQIRYFDIDYIAMGPFSSSDVTDTVGIEHYRQAMQYIHENNIEIPVVALGDINAADVKPLMQAGVNGLAVSEAIANAADIAATTAQIIALLDTPNRIG